MKSVKHVLSPVVVFESNRRLYVSFQMLVCCIRMFIPPIPPVPHDSEVRSQFQFGDLGFFSVFPAGISERAA